ncbi:cilia- and flagella-associated protein 418-like [Dysidea avara]|uniref:cilia- and flagella-associated protein 418-like n=1 Tax=Dysidea avara TaxID=196820 RepID=UPI0033322780
MEDDPMSDVEDLLDEMESTFSKPKLQPKSQTNCNSSELATEQMSPPNSDLDQLMADIIDDDDLDDATTISAHKPAALSNKQQQPQKKCFPCFLGGSIHARGLSTSSEQRACDQLLCTQCDFKVVSFDDYQWSSDCDYLFFRNNAPDFARLRVKLNKMKGSRAYACQCSWKSIRELTNVSNLIDVKWTCCRH